VLKQSSGIFSKFGAENPPLRQAAKRYMTFYENSDEIKSFYYFIIYFEFCFWTIFSRNYEK
jgi:hypothetical protein